MSLRGFHLFFVFVVSFGADLFGVWAVWRYLQDGDAGLLALGILCVLGGVGLIVYAVKLIRSFDRAEIH